jgi:hypothetical protein
VTTIRRFAVVRPLGYLCSVVLIAACGSGDNNTPRVEVDSLARVDSLAAVADAEAAKLAQRAAEIDAQRRAALLEEDRKRPRTMVLFNAPTMTLAAGTYEPTSFRLDSTGDCTLDGRVDVDTAGQQGSSGVQVLLLTAQAFDEWGKTPDRVASSALFSGGPQTKTTIHASVTEPGGYILVVSNRLPKSTPKMLSVSASVVCTGSDPLSFGFALPEP